MDKMGKTTSEERIERNTRAFGLDYNGALDMISENAEKAVSELIEVYDWETAAKVARISMDDAEKVFGCQNDESLEDAMARFVQTELVGEDKCKDKLLEHFTEWKWNHIKTMHKPLMKDDILFKRQCVGKQFEFQMNIYENLDVAVSVKFVPTCWESSNNRERSIEIETMAFD